MARGFAHPGVHEIGDATQRRNGTPDPGVTVILDSGSHINVGAQPRPKAGGCSGLLDGVRPRGAMVVLAIRNIRRPSRAHSCPEFHWDYPESLAIRFLGP